MTLIGRLWFAFPIVALVTAIPGAPGQSERGIRPVPRPKQLGPLSTKIVDVDERIQAPEARAKFGVYGATFAAAVLDTGLRVTHTDFTYGGNRVQAQANFTTDNQSNPQNAWDGNGHGTNVAGIIAANRIHVGIAPLARLVPLKVLHNDGSGNFDAVIRALDWVKQHHATHNITVVSLSLGDNQNYSTCDGFQGSDFAEYRTIRGQIQDLAKLNIPVVIAAGNEYALYNQTAGGDQAAAEGMAFPAILPEAISVGAVFSRDSTERRDWGSAIAYHARKDQITPFSQRLHQGSSSPYGTAIFAPGQHIISSGILSDTGESVQDGTSQACPVVSGVILLMQNYYKRITGKPAADGQPAVPGILPSVDQVRRWLKAGGEPITDACPEAACDNVVHTNKTFARINALKGLQAITDEVILQSFKEQLPPAELTNVHTERVLQATQRRAK